MTKDEVKVFALDIAEVLSNKKGRDVVVIDASDVTPLFDYIVIATADSLVHMNALVNYTEDRLNVLKVSRINKKNSYPETPWLLIDCGFMLVHLFLDEARSFYSLEKLWADGVIIYKDSKDNISMSSG